MKLSLLTCLSLAALLGTLEARASLGGAASSIEKDRSALEARMETPAESQSQKYSIHEMTQDGTQIREYLSRDGTVFAVSWRGTSQPDLEVLLGKYYKEYRDAASQQSSRRSRSSRVIRSRRMVMERSGHMRDVRGKAYVPNLLPEGFKPEEIS